MFYDIEKVKEIEVETVCELYGIELRRKGQNLWGKIRNEKTDSFSINPAKNIWRDWGMAEGGDVISLVSKLESTSYAEAIKILGSRFNIPTEDKSEEYKSLPTPNQFKEININSTRVSLNLDINLEKSTVEEVEKMYSDKKYSSTMYELSKTDEELYHQIIDRKSSELIERYIDIFVDINKKYKKETGKVEKMLYKDMLEELELSINNGIDIYNRSRLDNKDLNRFKVKFEPEMKKLEVEDLISKIEKSVEEYTETPEQLKEYMKFMSKFHKYSVSNNFLMQSQFIGASAVGSFKFWKDKGFSVNKGEKAIKILVPNKVIPKFLDENGKWKPLSKAGEKEKDKVKKGELELSEKLYFSIGNVFDISQTNAKSEDLPKIFPNKWLDGNVKDYSILYKGLENIANSIDVKIIEPKSELGVSKGCSYTLTREVALNPRNSELQNFKTLLHELAHVKLHTAETHTKYTSAEKEFQAELTAFTVCSYFNIDTSEYSLNYINHWSKGEIRDKQELLKEVNTTVKEYIGVLEETLINEKEIINMKGKEELLETGELYVIDSKEWIDKYFNDKDISREIINMLSDNDNFISLLDQKYYLDIQIDTLKEDIKHYHSESNTSSKEEDILKLELYTDLHSFVGKEINKTAGSDLENINHIEKEYTTESDIKLGDGSFIMEGTSFFVEGFRNGEFEVHFEVKEGNRYIPNGGVGDGYYLSEDEILRYSDLSKTKDLYRDEKKNLKEDIHQKVNIKEKEAVSDMISALKEKEIIKKVKDHEEWINSKGTRGSQLNLENENVRGMKFLDVDLRNSNMKNTDLRDCIFFADLKGANLTGAKIENSKFTGSNLGNITIEANKLNLIEYQIEQEVDKHKWANKSLSTNIKKKELERE